MKPTRAVAATRAGRRTRPATGLQRLATEEGIKHGEPTARRDDGKCDPQRAGGLPPVHRSRHDHLWRHDGTQWPCSGATSAAIFVSLSVTWMIVRASAGELRSGQLRR